jgi:hypothetical protein
MSKSLTPIGKPGEKAGCIDGKIKYSDNGKLVLLNERYCYDNIVKSLSSVRKCADKNDNQKECLINMPGPFPIKLKGLQTQTASIGFNICSKLKRISQNIEF